ncbi:MAG TPA: DegT/DnrJ/EryC1/StrS family aminotransferase, partial [Kofleriaceae bacterium]|nr:DegT/DnrJ/EryC1/StrS family aminotransferase [Kofleriaceae bacterium]
VHLGGFPADMTELTKLARSRGILVIEDACHAIGATYNGRKIGAGDSDAVVFSFHPVKHITTGEGGAVITRDSDLKRRVDRLRQHGINREAGAWAYEVTELGWNYRLSELSCALGIAQLAKLDAFVARRRQLVAQYRIELAGIPGVDVPVEPADRTSAYHLFAVAIDFDRLATTRQRVIDELATAGIGTQVHYIPLLHHPLHAARNPDQRTGPGAARYFARTLSLPLFPAMSSDDVSRVVVQLRRVLGVKP